MGKSIKHPMSKRTRSKKYIGDDKIIKSIVKEVTGLIDQRLREAFNAGVLDTVYTGQTVMADIEDWCREEAECM